jgi:hypothetical protein
MFPFNLKPTMGRKLLILRFLSHNGIFIEKTAARTRAQRSANSNTAQTATLTSTPQDKNWQCRPNGQEKM